MDDADDGGTGRVLGDGARAGAWVGLGCGASELSVECRKDCRTCHAC